MQEGSLSGGLCPEGFLSKGVTVQGGHCPRGSLSKEGLCLGGSLSREGLCQGDPPCGQTDAYENITLPQTSLYGGNKCIFCKIVK